MSRKSFERFSACSALAPFRFFHHGRQSCVKIWPIGKASCSNWLYSGAGFYRSSATCCCCSCSWVNGHRPGPTHQLRCRLELHPCAPHGWAHYQPAAVTRLAHDTEASSSCRDLWSWRSMAWRPKRPFPWHQIGCFCTCYSRCTQVFRRSWRVSSLKASSSQSRQMDSPAIFPVLWGFPRLWNRFLDWSFTEWGCFLLWQIWQMLCGCLCLQ